jgi:hypothetical protein
MLFDTQSPNRRRAVQVIFAFLALLMGGGLVLFGIGGNQQGGGLADIGKNAQTNVAKQAEKSAEQAQKVLAANPKDEDAAAKLALAKLTIAANTAFDPKTGKLTENGQAALDQADAAWTAYLKLGPAKPDTRTAYQFVTLYTSQGSVDYAKATRAMEAVLVTKKPTAGLMAQLAVYAVASGDNAKYKAARAKSLALASSAARRTAIAKELDGVEQDVADAVKAQQKAAKESGDTSTSTTPALKTLPSLGGVSSGGGLGG